MFLVIIALIYYLNQKKLFLAYCSFSQVASMIEALDAPIASFMLSMWIWQAPTLSKLEPYWRTLPRCTQSKAVLASNRHRSVTLSPSIALHTDIVSSFNLAL